MEFNRDLFWGNLIERQSLKGKKKVLELNGQGIHPSLADIKSLLCQEQLSKLTAVAIQSHTRASMEQCYQLTAITIQDLESMWLKAKNID